jgi:hypothetical protein
MEQPTPLLPTQACHKVNHEIPWPVDFFHRRLTQAVRDSERARRDIIGCSLSDQGKRHFWQLESWMARPLKVESSSRGAGGGELTAANAWAEATEGRAESAVEGQRKTLAEFSRALMASDKVRRRMQSAGHGSRSLRTRRWPPWRLPIARFFCWPGPAS